MIAFGFARADWLFVVAEAEVAEAQSFVTHFLRGAQGRRMGPEVSDDSI